MAANTDIVTRIISLIDKIRPFLISDGGNLEFIKFEDGIEEMIINEIPEVKEVRNISNN